ncbi:MAG: hypothetical protein ACYCYL_01320 [Acidithiobacillus sp.]
MKGHPEPGIELQAWTPILDALDDKRRQRLIDLLGWHMSHPMTVEQQIRKWENVLSASGIPAEQHIATLEASLEEAITVLKERVREQSSSASHRST